MKYPLAPSVILLFLCGALSKPLPAQLANITGAPFTGTVTLSLSGQPSGTEEIARASNGSTYDESKSRDGSFVHTFIVDIPNNRRIELTGFPLSHTYRIQASDRKIYTCAPSKSIDRPSSGCRNPFATGQSATSQMEATITRRLWVPDSKME